MIWWSLLWLAVASVMARQQSLKTIVSVGGIFSRETWSSRVAFEAALDRAAMFSERLTPRARVQLVASADSFAASKAGCSLPPEGVVTIFGPQEQRTAGAVESLCASAEIPHMHASWQPPPSKSDTLHPFTVNLYPDAVTLSTALAALVEDYDWSTFTVLYEDNNGLVRLQEVLKRATTKVSNTKVSNTKVSNSVRLRRLYPNEDNRSMLKELAVAAESRILLDCHVDHVLGYLSQAREVNLFEDYQSYIISSLDAHTLDFSPFQLVRANVTCFRMLDPFSSELGAALLDWRRVDSIAEWTLGPGPKPQLPPSAQQILLETALAADAASHLGEALEEMMQSRDVIAESIECGGGQKWADGPELLDYIKKKTSIGYSGHIEFDETGKRVNFKLDVVELSKTVFAKIAEWSSSEGIAYTRSEGETTELLAEKWQSKTFIVTSRLGSPFLQARKPKEEGDVLVGNSRYEGYSMDLIDGISKILNFSYLFELVSDGKYGGYNKETKKWDGLLKELLDRKADLGICDLTITSERRSAVDFTMPFMTLGISILYSKPVKQPPDLFSFLQPLSLDVWLYMATAYLTVSLMLFVLARIAPDDWENPHPCNKEPEELENIWDIKNCCWLTMGSLMTQGCDLLPKGVSTRWITGMWWFFALIMCSSYTANLAAFLTNERMDDTIDGAEDLAKQIKIKYGAVLGGSTASFFKMSNFSTYKRMWTSMESSRPSVFCSSNDEGVERVSRGKQLYAFLMESTSIEYVVERHCDLMQVGGLLDSKGYGIAMPVNSPYRTAISGAVLKMAEGGQLLQLKEKWWKKMYGGGGCKKDEEGDDGAGAAELGLENVGGVFVVLGAGAGIATAVALVEFLWNVRDVAVEEKISQKEALIAELKFALNFWADTKPVLHTPASKSSDSSKSSGSSDSGKSKQRPRRSRSRASSVLRAATSFLNMDKIFKE